MARVPNVVLKARVSGSTGVTIANSREVFKMEPRAFMLCVLRYYEYLLTAFRQGIRISARSPEGQHAPNLLLIEWPIADDEFADLKLRMPRHQRERWLRLGRCTGTADIGAVIQKAFYVYRNTADMTRAGWTFYATPSGGEETPISL